MKTATHLNALRAFEASARLGSFTAAANEIGVTPEAIGQLVRTLEAYLNIQLFHRNRGGKRLSPTQEALTVLPSLSDSFNNLSGILERLKGLSTTGILTVSTPPSVAAKWIVPLLPLFLQEETDIDIRMDITDRMLDISIGEADLGIRYGHGNWPGLKAIELVEDEKLFPVCCPQLLDAHPDIVEIPGLLKHTLIRDATMTNPRYPGWREWLQQQGFKNFDGAHFLEVNASLTAIEMAKLSQGIALAREHLVLSELADGTLVNLFPESPISTHWNYYIVTAKRPRNHVEHFSNWLEDKLKSKIKDMKAKQSARTEL